LVHRWRSEEQSILVGKKTVLQDDPHLDVRLMEGKNPTILVLGNEKDIPSDYHIYSSHPVFFPNKTSTVPDLETYCQKNNILSVLVEGGSSILQYFIDNNYWDEARVITNTEMMIGKGTSAPKISLKESDSFELGTNLIKTYYHQRNA